MRDPGVQGVLPPIVGVTPDAVDFQSRKSIITRMTVGQETNHQFLHTLGGDIFIYVFGDRVGQMTISGMCFAFDCDRPGDREHGLEKMLEFYRQNKLSRRKEPVTVMVGRTPVVGFIAGFNADVVDPKFNLVQYSLGLLVIPKA
jgi:hypothetical protein